uniref:Reverse transcriptase domain-containing protein n=1 Tax=Tanacetum cinerariifolium TaxID=118510 RepID=A0A699GLU4_TANCI|nr:hypothetical protein [Tanacetum cinerariifolium]
MVGGQGNDRGVGENEGGDGVPDFSIIIPQQLQNLLPTLLAQVGSQCSNQRNARNQSGDAVNDNIQGDVRNVIVNNARRVVPIRKTRNYVLKLRYGRGWPCAYIDRFHELARLVPYLVTPKNKRIERYIYGLVLQIRRMMAAMEPTIIQKAMQKAGTLTDEAIGNGSLKKNTKKRGNGGDPNKDMNVRDDNKRTRIANAFATTANLIRREYTGMAPKVVPRMVNPVNTKNPTAARGACFECGGTDHFKAACPRNNGNWARGGAFMLGEKKARQDPNIMTSTFTLNNHYATTLFDSGAAYSFVSIVFTPLLGIKTSNLGFSYEIEIASRQLVEINKVIRGCELEIEGYTFDIDLIPFGSGSFDVIVGMDWLSKHKAEIIFHENVVRIPLPNGETLRVVGKKPYVTPRQWRKLENVT